MKAGPKPVTDRETICRAIYFEIAQPAQAAPRYHFLTNLAWDLSLAITLFLHGFFSEFGQCFLLPLS